MGSFCGSGNKVSTSSVQSYTPNPQIAAAGTQALTGAQQAAQLPFQQPVAPVAGFSPFQQQAFGQIENMQGMTNPYFNQAAQYMQASAVPVTGQEIASNVGGYYNPFAQNVFSNLQDIYGQQQKQATMSDVAQAGGGGADRIGVAQANLAKQQQLAAGQTAASLYQPALQAAQTSALQGRQMMAGAGFGLGQLGPASQNAALQATGALGQAGAQQQALQQAQMNAQYQNILSQIAFPYQQPQYLAGITGGLAPAFGGTSTGNATTTYPTPSPLSQILGVGTALTGMIGGMGGLGGLSSMFGGSGGTTPIGSTYGATDMGSGFGYGSYGGIQVPTFFRRGGPVIDLQRIHRADGGSAYGDLAETQGRSAGNPYAAAEEEEKDKNYADGGDVDQPAPLPGSAPLPVDTTSIVPQVNISTRGGGHSGLFPGQSVDLKPIPLPSKSSSGSSGTTGGSSSSSGSGGMSTGDWEKLGISAGEAALKFLPMLAAAARGGAVNPYDAGMGFAEGGSLDEMRAAVDRKSWISGQSDWDRAKIPLQLRSQGLAHYPKDVAQSFGAQSAREVADKVRGYDDGGDVDNPFDRFPQAGDFKAGSDVMGDPAAARAKILADQQTRDVISGRTPTGPGVSSPLVSTDPAKVAQTDTTDELTPRTKITVPPGPRNPYIEGNPDLKVGDYLRSPNQPYPDALQRDWGQNAVRSPWMSLVKAGATMAGSVGPIGSVIGKGIAAGAGELESQRASLANEQQQNQKADALFSQAKQHLDQYQRMTPYQEATKDWRQTKLESPSGAAGWKYRAWLAANPGDEKGALEFAGGRRQVPEPQLRRWAYDQALKEKTTDPEKANINVDKRSQELFEIYKQGQQGSPQNNTEQLPQRAIDSLEEGQPTTFQNGQTWTKKNGVPVRVS